MEITAGDALPGVTDVCFGHDQESDHWQVARATRTDERRTTSGKNVKKCCRMQLLESLLTQHAISRCQMRESPLLSALWSRHDSVDCSAALQQSVYDGKVTFEGSHEQRE